MKIVCMLFFMVITTIANGQVAEFEGEIGYIHLFRSAKPRTDSSRAIRDHGRGSLYVYKNGVYKWVFNDADLIVEYSNGQTKKVYDKFRWGRDTLFSIKPSTDDTVYKYVITKNVDTILGYPVHMLTIASGKKGKARDVMTRRIFYSPRIPVSPKYFAHLTGTSNNKIFALTKGLPLRIEMEKASWPFVVRYEAVKVTRRVVQPAELALPKGAILKEVN
jgi:hypothetical protein